MSKLAALCFVAFSLASCGVDGAPAKPELHGTTKIGIGSEGVVTGTDLSLTINLG